MLKGFKQFLLRGNVVDLAVAVVIGGAFGAVVAALVKDLLTPLIAAIVGQPDFSGIRFTINGSKFLVGEFLNALVSFVLVAAAILLLRRGTDEHDHGAAPAAARPHRIPRRRSARSASVRWRLRRDGVRFAPSRSRSLEACADARCLRASKTAWPYPSRASAR